MLVQTFRTLSMLTLLFQNSASLNVTFASRSYTFVTSKPQNREFLYLKHAGGDNTLF